MAEIISWLQDTSEYLRVSRRRKEMRQPGQGFDYTGDEYRDLVRRVVEQLHPRRMHLRVAEIVPQAVTTKTFRYERTDGPSHKIKHDLYGPPAGRVRTA